MNTCFNGYSLPEFDDFFGRFYICAQLPDIYVSNHPTRAGAEKGDLVRLESAQAVFVRLV